MKRETIYSGPNATMNKPTASPQLHIWLGIVPVHLVDMCNNESTRYLKTYAWLVISLEICHSSFM